MLGKAVTGPANPKIFKKLAVSGKKLFDCVKQ
jgi:hypothetical protein